MLELVSAFARQLGAFIQYRILAETLPVCIFYADMTGNWLYVNQRWSEITGISSNLALGRGWINCLHPLDKSRVETEWYTAISERKSFKSEYRFARQDGSICWVIAQAIVEINDEGQVTGYIGTITDISERKQIETELLSTRARLEYLLTYTPVVIFSCRAGYNYDVTFISANVKALLGYEAQEFLKNSNFWRAHIHPDDIERVITNLSQPWEEEIYSQEFRFRHKSGEYLWIYAQLRLVKDETGNPLEYVGYWVDISERIRVEKSLHTSKAMNRALLNAIPDLMFRCLPDGTYIDFKPAKGTETWVPPEVFLGKKVQEVLPPDLAEKFLAAYQQALASGETQILEYQLQLGEKICCYYEARIVANENNNEILVMVRDISERKKAEQALQEIAEREKVFSNIIKQIHQSLDIQTIFNTTTSELLKLLKCERVAIYSLNPNCIVAESFAPGWKPLLDITKKEAPLFIEDFLKHCLSATQIAAPYESQETSSSPPNYFCVSDVYQAGLTSDYIKFLEKLQILSYLIVPIFCHNKLWGILATYQNSCPRKWSESEIKIALRVGEQLGVALQHAELLAQTQKQSAALQQAVLATDTANRAKSIFLANMSHELRTPLNAILGFTQVMVRDNSLTAQQQEKLRIINRAGEHLLALIDDILEMSKIEAGRITLNPKSFDLIKLLQELQEMLRTRARTKELQLNFEIAPDVPQYIYTDERKLRQVLINILGNAIKFTETGWIALRVKVLKPAADTRLFFEIEDTGKGIKPSELNQLFEPFIQTETGYKSQQGTGLGLAISRKFVQLMGGDISVTSTPLKGSTFSFDIPVKVVNACEVETSKPQCKVIAFAPNQPEYKILVVDDRSESRLLLVTLLTSIGFAVREAENGLQAIAVWENWQPHLILMDMRMPVMDGYEATKQIKSRLKENQTTIIALTASAFEEERKKILSAGCDDFISKPFKEELLLEKVRQHLGVVYVYEQETKIAEASGQKTQAILTDEELKYYLSQMPEAWLNKIYNASRDGSDDDILEALQEIPLEIQPLASALTELATNYEFQKIIELTQPGEEGKQ
ncbi:MAG: PAS domain-containing protein [Oscillatoriaceae bacterium SKW80]|nr:PAS domain-containing protein [Oscillatoriaceae bacterium SKYG93]MCX8121750.1 PAS domain-containing protein [Oscillatoriaceae bacterium SKW80]MDW8453634.1 PAS domain-containing protein [Oscillatoriaceae cyanobacterium SKYGB_i_bin93]HIK28699.1 PAS domain-containing protein [Oscillatoriaceae cyanobacterium M7585_C2015_266]